MARKRMSRPPDEVADEPNDHAGEVFPSRISPPFDPPRPLLPPRSAAEQARDDADEVPNP